MKTEPVAIVAAARAVLLLVTATGLVAFTDTDIEKILTGIGGIYLIVEVVMTLWTRASVYSPSTHEDEVAETKRNTRLKTLAQVDAQLGEQVIAPLPPVIKGAGHKTGGN